MDAADVHHETNRTFYDRISGAYDWISDANEGPARRAGVAALNVKGGEKVIELGFGTGNEVLDFAALVGPNGLVAGIDISPGMLAVTQKKLAEKPPAAKTDLLVGDARELPFATDWFDVAFTSFTLELFPAEDIPTVLTEVKRVLKPGGRFGVVCMATVRTGEKASGLEKTYIWMHRHFPHLVDCRPIDPVTLLKDAGYTIQSEARREIWTMPVAVVVATV